MIEICRKDIGGNGTRCVLRDTECVEPSEQKDIHAVPRCKIDNNITKLDHICHCPEARLKYLQTQLAPHQF